MRHKIAIISLLTAWFLATGSQWDFVQTFAWAKMLAGYAKVMPLSEAVAETFDADKPCALCRAVTRAKQQQDNSPPPEANLRAKLIYIFQPTPAFVITLRPGRPWSLNDWVLPPTEKSAPPVPPPRGQV
jgi:hypothetical protein